MLLYGQWISYKYQRKESYKEALGMIHDQHTSNMPSSWTYLPCFLVKKHPTIPACPDYCLWQGLVLPTSPSKMFSWIGPWFICMSYYMTTQNYLHVNPYEPKKRSIAPFKDWSGAAGKYGSDRYRFQDIPQSIFQMFLNKEICVLLCFHSFTVVLKNVIFNWRQSV